MTSLTVYPNELRLRHEYTVAGKNTHDWPFDWEKLLKKWRKHPPDEDVALQAAFTVLACMWNFEATRDRCDFLLLLHETLKECCQWSFQYRYVAADLLTVADAVEGKLLAHWQESLPCGKGVVV